MINWLLVLLLVALSECLVPATGTFNASLTPSDTIAYYRSPNYSGEITSTQLRFTFDPNCTNQDDMLILQSQILFPIDNSSSWKWTVSSGLEFDGVTNQYYIDAANFTESGNYASAVCFTSPLTTYLGGEKSTILIKVKPKILHVDLGDDSQVSEGLFEKLETYNLTANFYKNDPLKLSFHVGNGYYGNAEIGQFSYDTNLLGNLTDGGVDNETSFVVENYPDGTIYSFNLSLNRAIETSPMKCKFASRTSAFMASDREKTTHSVTVNLELNYEPKNVKPFVSANPSDGTCTVGCSVESGCPAIFDEAKLEIYDAKLGLTILLNLTETSITMNSSAIFWRNFNESACYFLRHLKEAVENGAKTSVFKCTVKNPVGTGTFSQQIEEVDGINQLKTTSPSTSTISASKSLSSVASSSGTTAINSGSTTVGPMTKETPLTDNWWFVFMIIFLVVLAICAVFLAGALIVSLIKGDKKKQNGDEDGNSNSSGVPVIVINNSSSDPGYYQNNKPSNGTLIVDNQVYRNSQMEEIEPPRQQGKTSLSSERSEPLDNSYQVFLPQNSDDKNNNGEPPLPSTETNSSVLPMSPSSPSSGPAFF